MSFCLPVKLLRSLHRALASAGLAVGLLLLLAAVAVVATVAPRGSALIAASGLDRFPRSALFLVPAALLFVNAAVCAAGRFARRRRSAAPPRFGPDLVHLGVLLLIAAGILTAAARREGSLTLAEGDRALLAGEYLLTLRSCRLDSYPDGRPRDWVSTVDVSRGGAPVASGFAIEVNRPLRVGRLRVLQAGYGRQARVTAAGAAGGGREIREVDVTVLRVVEDPGLLPAKAALALIAVGLTLTAVRKTKDRQP